MRPLLSFFTALPLGAEGAPDPLEAAARQTYLLPLVGLVTGLPGALFVFLAFFLPSGVAASLAFGAVLLASGLHHADGVLDVGDALMVRGSRARRREALKDSRVGVGGLGALFAVYAPALAALSALAASPVRAALALIAAEVAARSAMVLVLAYGRPAEETSSSVPFVRALEGRRRVVGITLALLAPLALALPLGGFALLAVLMAPAVAFAGLRVAHPAFDGISGDVVGATGEAARTALLVALSAI